MKILKLQAENVKRIHAVEINPDGNMVIIGGRNGQGKSSVLDSIMYAFAGKREICGKPLRDGTDEGTVTVNLDNGLIAKRTFKADGSSKIEVYKEDGAKYSSPQGMLDGLYSSLGFDPLAFIRLESRKQLETLRKIVGLDFSELDAKRNGLYSQRTTVNRDVTNLKGQVSNMPWHEEVPESEVSIYELIEQLDKAKATNAENENSRRYVSSIESNVQQTQERIDDIDRQIETLKLQKAEMQESLKVDFDNLKEAKAEAANLQDIDTTQIEARIRNAEVVNQKVRENQAVKNAKARLAEAMKESENLTTEIEKVDNAKALLLTEAKFPVEGLMFNEDSVLFNGVPFDQASSAEQLRVSAAMAAAMNPELRIMLIRDGSLLDDDSMQLLAEFAEQNDFQIWLEAVSTDAGKCSVILEDGRVAVEEPVVV